MFLLPAFAAAEFCENHGDECKLTTCSTGFRLDCHGEIPKICTCRPNGRQCKLESMAYKQYPVVRKCAFGKHADCKGPDQTDKGLCSAPSG